MISNMRIKFPTANLLRKAGFEQDTDYWQYLETGELVMASDYGKSISAPTQAQVLRYMRKEHGIHISPRYVTHHDKWWWVCDIIPLHNCDIISDEFCCEKIVCSHVDAYTEAEQVIEVGIATACVLIINYKSKAAE